MLSRKAPRRSTGPLGQPSAEPAKLAICRTASRCLPRDQDGCDVMQAFAGVSLIGVLSGTEHFAHWFAAQYGRLDAGKSFIISQFVVYPFDEGRCIARCSRHLEKDNSDLVAKLREYFRKIPIYVRRAAPLFIRRRRSYRRFLVLL
jgi:hypothetical protein